MENIENKILEKVEKMRLIQAELKEIETLEVPEEPKPSKVYTLEEFEKYRQAFIIYDTVIRKKSSGKKELLAMYNATVDEIINLLPSGNTWFKIGRFYIGYETDDWPGSKPDFFLKEDVPESSLRSLKHKHIEG